MRRLFLFALFIVAVLTKTDPGSAHEYSRFGTVESLVERGTFQLDDSTFITRSIRSIATVTTTLISRRCFR